MTSEGFSRSCASLTFCCQLGFCGVRYCERNPQDISLYRTKEKDSTLSVVRFDISEEKYLVNRSEIILRVVISSSSVVSRCVQLNKLCLLTIARLLSFCR